MAAVPVALLLVLVTAAAPAPGAGVYRWVDAAGRTHYGDRPPPGVEARALEVDPAADTAFSDDRSEQTQRLLEAFERKRERDRQAREQARAEEDKRARRCANAQRRLRGIERAGPLYREGTGGRRNYVDDAERAALREQAQRSVQQWCD